jgi:hypothetical protein
MWYYYAIQYASRSDPDALYRYDGVQAEVYGRKTGWKPDTQGFIANQMSGELSELDKISEERASQIIETWRRAARD